MEYTYIVFYIHIYIYIFIYNHIYLFIYDLKEPGLTELV